VTKDALVARLATTGAVASVLLVAATAVYPVIRTRLAARDSGASYSAGEHIDVPASIYERASHTLVVFAESGCGACQRMKPMLAALVRAASQISSAAVVMVSPASDRDAQLRYASEIGLDNSRVTALDLTALRLRSVPTVAVVSPDGRVHYAHTGAPTSREEEDEMTRAVLSLLLDR